MITIFYSIVGLVICVTVVGIIWRLFSNRSTLPCPVWLGWLVELDNPFTKTNQANVIIGHLNLQPAMKVLDIGCGPGRLTIPVAEKIGQLGEVVAMDMQQGMLQRVQEKARAKNIHNIRLIQAKIGDGTLEHATYDRALLVTVLGEIPVSDRHIALKEIFDALKPGGILSITEVIFDPHFQTIGTVLQLATAVGFQKKDIFGHRFAFTMLLEKPAKNS